MKLSKNIAMLVCCAAAGLVMTACQNEKKSGSAGAVGDKACCQQGAKQGKDCCEAEKAKAGKAGNMGAVGGEKKSGCCSEGAKAGNMGAVSGHSGCTGEKTSGCTGK